TQLTTPSTKPNFTSLYQLSRHISIFQLSYNQKQTKNKPLSPKKPPPLFIITNHLSHIHIPQHPKLTPIQHIPANL
ncbi:hypothetical protein, partial [Bacillus pumilus]|uniref:hypothetical protein n=1 Tax=Bacillus pumilus TaxID=1408 RepID=UPI001C92C6B1